MRLGERLRLFLSPSASAETLAYLRIVVFLSLIVESVRSNPVRFARLPVELFTAPTGWGPWLTGVPGSPAVVGAVWAVFITAAFAAALGWRARITTKLAAVTAVYVLGIPHLFDLPNHQITHHHHLVWFALILAVSPCSDAWALDAAPAKSTRSDYAPPIAAVWALVGLIYFFPGFWKITGDGLGWASGEKLRVILQHRWFHLGGFTPMVRVDAWPPLLKTASIVTMTFEVLFIFCIFVPRMRLVAVFFAAGFHSMTAVFMNLTFWPLMVCLPVFFNWSAWRAVPPAAGARVDLHALGRAVTGRPAQAAVAATLIGMTAFCGAFRIDSWPFACYPTFNRFHDPLIDTLEISFIKEGRAIPHDMAPVYRHLGRSRWHRLIEVAVTQEQGRARRLKGVTRRIELHNPGAREADSVLFYRLRGRYDPGTGRFNEVAREELSRLDAEEALPEADVGLP